MNGNVIGSVMEGEALRDENGNIIGIIMPDGRVADLDGNILGRINANGEIVDESGNVLGTWRGGKLTAFSDKLKQKRFAFGKDGKRIGTILADGTVVDENGRVIGRVLPDGTVVDESGNVIGYSGGSGEFSPSGEAGTDNKDKDKISVFGTFDPDRYRYYGKGGSGADRSERYDPARIKMLREMQLAFRRQIRPGMGMEEAKQEDDALLRKQKKSRNWNDLGYGKESISSYRVNMDHMILADKAIPAVITRSIDTEQSDLPITAIVERNIYSEVGRKIIIPAGSRVIGELSGSSKEDIGSATKVEISWKRLIRPDGAAFSFDDGVSGDASGRAGVGAYMDRQLIKKYGLPLVQSSITSAFLWAMASKDSAAVGQDGEVAVSGRQQAAESARTRFSDTMQQIFDDLIADTTKVKTRLFVPSGTRVTIFANKDLWLRSAEEDEEEDLGLRMGRADVLIDPNKKDYTEKEEGSGGGLVAEDDGTQQPNPNDPNNLQQQQQIYYNNYTGQRMPPPPQQQQQQRPQQQRPQQQTAVPPVQQQTAEEETEAIPELF